MSNQIFANKPSKKIYRKPEFHTYGSISTLTTGNLGSGCMDNGGTPDCTGSGPNRTM